MMISNNALEENEFMKACQKSSNGDRSTKRFFKYHSEKNIQQHEFAPKPKPKATFITPSPMILCTHAKLEANPFSLSSAFEDEHIIDSENESGSARDSNEREEKEDEYDDISALPKSNLKLKTRNDPFMRKESKDAEEVLGKKKSIKLISTKEEDIDVDLNSINLRNTISICPGKSMIGYSILNYLEMTCNDNSPLRKSALNNKGKHGVVNHL